MSKCGILAHAPLYFCMLFKENVLLPLKMKRVTLLGAIFLLVAHATQAQNYKLRTVVIYSFTRYIHWPQEYASMGTFDIKVFGDSPIIDELGEMARIKTVGDRPIVITKVASLEGIETCHILFVPAAQSGKLAGILKKLEGKSTLVITEQPGLGQQGSDINFLDNDGKLTFELNQSSLKKRELKASSELTRLAILI